MTERLKDLFFSDKFIKELGDSIKEVYPDFDLSMFNQFVFGDDWENKELKQMMHHMTQCRRLRYTFRCADNGNNYSQRIRPIVL